MLRGEGVKNGLLFIQNISPILILIAHAEFTITTYLMTKFGRSLCLTRK